MPQHLITSAECSSLCEGADEKSLPVVQLCQREWCASGEFLGGRHAHGPHYALQSWTCVLEQPVSERGPHSLAI